MQQSRVRSGRHFTRQAVSLSGIVLSVIAMFRICYFDLLIYNPLWSSQAVGKFLIFNALLLTYGLPIVWTSKIISHIKKVEWKRYSYIFMLLLSFVLVSLNVRQMFHGEYPNKYEISNFEIYAYSIIWLIFGIILLLFGALQQNQSIRIASLVVMILTVEKYFSMTHQSLLDCCVYSLSLALDSVGFMHSLFSESVKNNNLLNMAKYQITTPRKNKESIDILYGYHSTTFGKALIGVTAQSICHLSFCDFETSAIGILEKEWSQACLKEDRLTTEKIVHNIFDIQIPERSFSLLVKGTDFQIKVWQALLSIPKGTTTAYENIAHIIDKPKAVRATANAIANNPISYLIPCHRVIRKSGEINKYRWGIERKKAILAYELNFMRHNVDQ